MLSREQVSKFVILMNNNMKENNNIVISNKVIHINNRNTINIIKTTNININNTDKWSDLIKIDYMIEIKSVTRLRYEFNNDLTHHINIIFEIFGNNESSNNNIQLIRLSIIE